MSSITIGHGTEECLWKNEARITSEKHWFKVLSAFPFYSLKPHAGAVKLARFLEASLPSAGR